MAADDDAEVFEITDFTTASEWERFISRVEEILHEWKLVGCCPKPPAPKGAYTGGVWEERVEELSFADFKFCMVHHWLRCDDEKSEKAREKETDQDDDEEEKTPTVYGDLLNMENDFPSRAHCLCRWYGVQDFLILSPALDIEAILSESKVKLLLSSVSIALSEAGCYVPVFVQVHQKWRRLYHGTCVLPGSSVEFGMVHLKRAPPQYSHLAGLLDVFKAKQCSMAEQRPPVSVAVRFLYMLYDWVNSPWTQPLPDFDDEVGCTGFDNLPFGACEDPVSALQLYCTWPSLSEDMIVENQVYSDLDPLQAPLWSVKIQMTEDPQCLLGEYLIHFLALCHRKETLDQLIGSLASSTADAESGADISQALHKLTEPSMGYTIPSFSAYVQQSQKHKARDSAIPGEMLDDILQYLFPDSKTCLDKSEEQSEPSLTVNEHSESCRQMEKDLSKQLKSSPTDSVLHRLADLGKQLKSSPTDSVLHRLADLGKQLKSSPTDSVLHRLAVCMCILNQNNDYGGFGAVAQIWSEFVLEMRYRWENKYNIVGIEKGPPNLGTCILQQKLQMLNCCIEHKKKREQLHKGYTGETTYYSGSSDFGPSTSRISRTFSDEEDEEYEAGAGDVKGLGSSSDDDDEFFECDNDEQTSEKVSENLTEEKEIDESAADQSDDSADNQSNSMEVSSENVQNQSPEMTGIDADNQSNLEQQAESDNQSTEMAESCDISNDSQRRTSSQNQSRGGAEKDNRPGSVAGSQPRDSISNVSMQSDSAFQESFTHKPEGRLAPFQDLTLVNCNEKMYIPITQEPAPMTEDMLEEHAEVLAKLGTSAEGAELRARMQSACLLSDMESFKEIKLELLVPRVDSHVPSMSRLYNFVLSYDPFEIYSILSVPTNFQQIQAANPGCVLEDFVRWYSPRDWVEEKIVNSDGSVASKGHLSLRMQIPGNMWVEVWQTARPVPARRQKRLFDDTKEAEKVLHYLSAMKPADVVVCLLPMLIHAALLKVMENDDPKIPLVKQALEQACSKASIVTRAPLQDVRRYEEVVRMIIQAEVIIARNLSLKSKFTDSLLERPDAADELHHFVACVLQNSEVAVRGGPLGPAGTAIQKLFYSAQRSSYSMLDDEPDQQQQEERQATSSIPKFPRPTGREYILRTTAPRPAPYSKILPQRMFCSIEDEEFRLAGAFSSDTVFQ